MTAKPYEFQPKPAASFACSLEAVDIERRTPRADKPAKRAKKLRAVSGACSRRSSNRQHRRGGELLPVRRTLFQVDVLGFRNNVRALRSAAVRATVCDNGEQMASCIFGLDRAFATNKVTARSFP